MITLLFLALFSDTVGMSLDQALALARHKSPTRDDAHLSEQSAQLTYLTAWRSLVPTPSTSAGFGIRWGKSPLGRDTVTQAWTISVSANQLFFDPVALGGISRADLGRRMAALGAQAQLCQQILDVKTAYFELQKLYGLRLLATRAVAQASDNLELVRQRQRLGSATSLDVMRVELSLHQARLDLAAAEQSLLSASERLKGLLGLVDESVVRPDSVRNQPWPELPFASFGDFWSLVQDSNLTLLLSTATKLQAQRTLWSARARVLPTLSLSAGHNYSASEPPGGIGGPSWKNNSSSTLSVGLSLPILDLPSHLLNVRTAELQLQQAQVSHRQALIGLHQAAMNTWLAYERARSQLDYAISNLKLSNDLYRLAQEQYRLGQLTTLDLFSVETALTQAEVGYLNALCDIQKGQAQIDYLLGRWPSLQ